MGVKGIIASKSGEPLQATIVVEGRPGFVARTHRETGYYHRMLLPGTYQITVRLNDSGDSQTKSVQVVDGAVSQLNFEF